MFSSLAALSVILAGVDATMYDRHTCVEMFQHHNAGGWSEKIYASRKQGSGNWYYWDDPYFNFYCNIWGSGSNCRNNAVSSFKVPSGCYFKPACNKNYNYEMDMFVGPKYINLVRSWDDCITSYRCWCNRNESPEMVTPYGWPDWVENRQRRLEVNETDSEAFSFPNKNMTKNEDEIVVETYVVPTTAQVLEGTLDELIGERLADPTSRDDRRHDELIITVEETLFKKRHAKGQATPFTEAVAPKILNKEKNKAARKAKRKKIRGRMGQLLSALPESDSSSE